MKSISYQIAAFTVLSALAGCSSFTPPARIKTIPESGAYWVSYSAEKRGAIILRTQEGDPKIAVKTCAEPAPDTSKEHSASASDQNLTVKIGEKTIILPGRSASLLALRESLYRLCELSLNRPGITDAQMLDIYKSTISAIIKSSQDEATTLNQVTNAVLTGK